MTINNNNFNRYALAEIKANTNYKITFTADGTFCLQFSEGRMESSIVKPLTKPLKGIAASYNISIKTVNGGMLFVVKDAKNSLNNTWTQLTDFVIEEVI